MTLRSLSDFRQDLKCERRLALIEQKDDGSDKGDLQGLLSDPVVPVSPVFYRTILVILTSESRDPETQS